MLDDWVKKAQATSEKELTKDNAPGDGGGLYDRVIAALKNVYDPEIPVNIYDLGLIYDLEIDENKKAFVKMTLTTPGCPVAQTFPGTVECAVKEVEGIEDAEVELVWDPPWSKDMMTDAAKLQLNML